MKLCSKQTHLAVLSCLAALQLPALAQSSQLRETVVTASRIEQPLADVLSSVTLITRADIERSQAASLADLLQGEAGFEFGRNGGPGATTSFFLRGAASTNLVVMIDGVRTMVDGWGNLTSVDMPLAQIERVELLRGNASALYGEAAVGGVLHIITRSAEGKSGAYGAATLGSRNTQIVSAGYAGGQGDLSFRLDAGKEHTDGFSAMNQNQNARVNPDNDSFDRTHVSAKVIKKLSRDLTLGANMSAISADAAYDDGSPNSTPPATSSDTHQLRRDTSMINVYAQARPGENWNSRLDLSRTYFELRDVKNGVPKQGSYDSGLNTGQQNALRWFNTLVMSPERIVNFGLETGDESFTADATVSGYRAGRQLRGYFVGLNQALDKFSLQGNLRYDSVSVNKADTAYAKTWDNTSGLIGLGYRLTDAWRLTASMATGFRVPSAGELSNNIDLQPETHLSREAGVSYASGSDSMRVVAFTTRTSDAIYFQTSYPYTPINIGKVRNEGVEVSGNSVWRDVRIRYSYVTQDPWNESDGTRLARRARQYGTLDVSRVLGVTSLGARIYTADQRYDSNAPDKNLPGYSTLAFYASRPLDKDWTVRVKVENALDRPYQLAYGYNTPPFGMWVTLAYQQR